MGGLDKLCEGFLQKSAAMGPEFLKFGFLGLADPETGELDTRNAGVVPNFS